MHIHSIVRKGKIKISKKKWWGPKDPIAHIYQFSTSCCPLPPIKKIGEGNGNRSYLAQYQSGTNAWTYRDDIDEREREREGGWKLKYISGYQQSNMEKLKCGAAQ